MVGYVLSGATSEQCLFLLHGHGANGKSVFLAILRALLGAYAYNAPFSTFELAGRTDITNDIAALAGMRLVTASETNEGTRLNEALVEAPQTPQKPATASPVPEDLPDVSQGAKVMAEQWVLMARSEALEKIGEQREAERLCEHLLRTVI